MNSADHTASKSGASAARLEYGSELTRQQWLSALAKAPLDEFEGQWATLTTPPSYRYLRKPEVGLAMVRGRTGGTGQAFNLGEMTVTRCSIRLSSGTVGHGYLAGRDTERAEKIAVLDALFQEDGALADKIVPILKAATAEVRMASAQKAAATKVDFFTMTRGENL